MFTRGYLPHVDAARFQAVTFRLHDSLPKAVVARWRAELFANRRLRTDVARALALHHRIARFEDTGHGACYLERPEIARLVCRALLRFDGIRYDLREWCVMPNHVHVLVRPREGQPLAEIVRYWKGWAARRANQLLGRRGPFWMREYHDRFIRSERHMANAVRYIRMNPVLAGLCQEPEDWPWGSASTRPGYGAVAPAGQQEER